MAYSRYGHPGVSFPKALQINFLEICQTLVELVLSKPHLSLSLFSFSPTPWSSCRSNVLCCSAPLGPYTWFPLCLCLIASLSMVSILCYCQSLGTGFPDNISERPPSYLLFPVNSIQAPRFQLQAFFFKTFSFMEIQPHNTHELQKRRDLVAVSTPLSLSSTHNRPCPLDEETLDEWIGHF